MRAEQRAEHVAASPGRREDHEPDRAQDQTGDRAGRLADASPRARSQCQVGGTNEVDAPVVGGDDDMVAAPSGGADPVGCDLPAKDLLVGKRDPDQLAPVVRYEHGLVVEEADRLGRAASERDGVEEASVSSSWTLRTKSRPTLATRVPPGSMSTSSMMAMCPRNRSRSAPSRSQETRIPSALQLTPSGRRRMQTERLDGVLVDAERPGDLRVGRHLHDRAAVAADERDAFEAGVARRRGSC